jgi:hypothetical protein
MATIVPPSLLYFKLMIFFDLVVASGQYHRKRGGIFGNYGGVKAILLNYIN